MPQTGKARARSGRGKAGHFSESFKKWKGFNPFPE
jgi:hypothetical protein